jgi:hypothetical protein
MCHSPEVAVTEEVHEQIARRAFQLYEERVERMGML